MDEAKVLLDDIYDQQRRLPRDHRTHPRLHDWYVVVIHPEDLQEIFRVNADNYATVVDRPRDTVFGFETRELISVPKGHPRLMLREDAEDLAAE